MLGRAGPILVAFIIASTTLAGCIGGEEEAPALETQDTNGVDGVANESEKASPVGRDISAFNETNKTETGMGGMMHSHDYWNGAERLEVGWIDAGLIPFPLFPCKRPDGACTVGSNIGSDTYPGATAIADFDLAPPPEMGMVYEGTKQVEVTLAKFTGPEGGPANPLGKVYFDYLTAADEAGAFRKGGELKLNEPFVIEIDPLDADMPHQTKSLWIFRIYSNSEMVWFEFNITITAVRGYDVVNWPPHPDLYADKPDRIVYEGPVKLSSKGTIDSNLFGSDAGWVRPERVISWGTDRLEITVTEPKFTSPVPVAPAGYVFEFHNASKPPLLGHGAQYGGRLTDSGSDGTSYHFKIDLTADRGDAMDTPYAQNSRWGFRLVPQFDNGGAACVDHRFLQQILVGCQFVPWEMTYNMKIVAYGHSTAGGAPEAVG